MKIINYKSLGTILWRVLKNPLAAELTYEEAAEYALEFIKLLGAPVAYEDKLDLLELQMYKAELPCNILNIRGIRYINIDENGNQGSATALRESTNIYHLDPSEHVSTENLESRNQRNASRTEFTYSIQRGILFTSICDGVVEISYKGIATDEEGYPMVPDNEKVTLGLEYYILSRYLEPMYLMGKITDKAFEYIQQKRYFYMPSAFTSLTMPDMDGMESMMNGINRLILPVHTHESFYKKQGEAERLRKFR